MRADVFRKRSTIQNQFLRPLARTAAILLGTVSLAALSTRAAECAGLARLQLKDTSITSARIIPAAGAVPEYCQVLGSIHNLPHSTILFEVSLPTTKWNGKYFVAGGGGFNGSIPKLTQALTEGYAAAGSDTGHVAGKVTDGTWALNNLDAQINYAYLATHVVTVIGKQIVREFYSRPEERSYFVGCSNGGKMALTELQRYPNDFDGVIAGDPAIERTRLAVHDIWEDRALTEAPIPPEKVPAIDKATFEACKISGTAVGGVLTTPGRCKFDPKKLLCTAGDKPDCLTAPQVQALQKVLDGPRTSTGIQLFPGFVPGHEEDWPNYITYKIGKDGEKIYPYTWATGDIFMRDFVFGENYDPIKQFNFDKDYAALQPLADQQDNAKSDLSEFKAHGGKLIMYHGWADHSIPSIYSIQYFATVVDTMGKQQPGEEDTRAISDFARLFVVPGMHHCNGGPGPHVFGGANQGLPKDLDAEHDIVEALDRWVETGVPPQRIVASQITNGIVDRTQMLCPYPQLAVYDGTGDQNKAESFHCEMRPYWWALEAIPNAKPAKAAPPSAPAHKHVTAGTSPQ